MTSLSDSFPPLPATGTALISRNDQRGEGGAMSGEWGNPGKPLPRVPGMCSGLVAKETREGQAWFTVQCAVCYRTYTDMGVIAMSTINHRGDQGILTVPYRRCEECREKCAHPESEMSA